MTDVKPVSDGNSPDLNNHHIKMRGDIDETTQLSDVKAPNVFKRAKEEIEAVIGAIHQSKRDESDKTESKSEKPENGEKKPNMIKKAKEEIESIFHHHRHHHHKETHGRSDDIDENTPLDEVKGPNVFERAKEEIEAIVDTIKPKKKEKGGSRTRTPSPPQSRSSSPEKERAGFGCSLGKGLQKVCHPWGDSKKD